MSLTIDELVAPDSLDDAGAEEFAAYLDLRNAVEAHTLGTDLLTPTPTQLLPEYRDNPTRKRRHFVARVGGSPVGRAIVTSRPHTPGAGVYVLVDVLPAHRGRGLGAALLDVVEAAGLSGGESALKVALAHSAVEGGDRVVAPTGFGDVPARDPGVRFLTAHGYALEQVVRISVLDTAGLGSRLAPLMSRAQAAAGDDYRLDPWVGATPVAHLEDVAALRTRMSTDAPMGGMQAPPDPWDAARVTDHDERVSEGGNFVLTTGVEHVPSGHLVGFTEVVVPAGRPAATQEDTLVLREHRGHRLGMLLKTATAHDLLRVAPQVEAVVTWNAEENRPMLDVNEAMGFRAIGYEGGWQKRVQVAGE